MTRVLIISPFFYPHVGGSQAYMENIYAFLINKHPKIKVDVLCYDTDQAGESSIYQGLTIHRIPSFNLLKGQFALPHPLKLIKFLWKNRQSFDLYHCSTRFFDSSVWVPVWAKLIGKPAILTDHCASHPVHKNILIGGIARVFDLSLFNLSLHLFDKVIATNKATQQFLKRTFNIKAQVIYGGVDTTIFQPYEKVTDRIQVVFVGRMIETKGAGQLFQIAQKIKQANFTFAGPGPLVKIFKNEIKKKKLTNIKIAGPLSKVQVARLLQQSHILAHPSFHHEGFPNSLLEAGASKLATIATNVGGSKEIIIHNKTGILIKPRDKNALEQAILTLIKRKNLRNQLALNLYKYISAKFTWERASEKLYQEIANSHLLI